MPTRVILATAGHVDHGKSALVRALTGTDPDRLPEEKARGITIDLGFAHLGLPSAADPSFEIGIIDVPGHEDFVANMVAGVGAIDLALLVVAADDGWMPQTEEHLQILDYFGVQRAIVALTKADLVQDEAGARAAVRERLRGSPFAEAPVVPTSVVTGRGLDALRTVLFDALANSPAPRDLGKPRLAVDRVFSLPGAGTIATGTLVGGTLRRGQVVVVQPGARAARIRRLQSHGRDANAIGPGSRAALNLSDVSASDGVHRGNVITTAALGGASACLDVELRVSPRATRVLKDGIRVRVHHGSGNAPAHVALAAGKELPVGASTLARLRLEAPALLCAGDRLTLRDWSGQHTLAGGRVLDPEAGRQPFRHAARHAWLARVASALEDPEQFVLAHVSRRGLVHTSVFAKTRFSDEQISQAIDRLARSGAAVASGEIVADAARLAEAERHAADLIERAHRERPDRRGLPLTELRRALSGQFPFDELFDVLTARLCERGYERTGTDIHRTTYRAQLPESLHGAGERLREALATRPLEPPSRKELTPDAAAQRALTFLIETGEVVDINSDLVLSASAVEEATARVRAYIRSRGPATVSDLRQALGSSRRVVIPLLEYLDRTLVTVRQADTRKLR